MAVTNMALVNAALRKLGARALTDWDETSQNGRLVREAFARIRDAEIRAARWTFALTRAVLPALAGTPAWGYRRAFPLPADCLALVQVGDHDVTYLPMGPEYRRGDAATWALEGNVILCDFPAPLRIRYSRRLEEPTLFDPLFDEALACRLAVELCEAITQSAEKKRDLAEEYKAAIRAARRANAIEKHPEFPSDGAWLMSRISG